MKARYPREYKDISPIEFGLSQNTKRLLIFHDIKSLDKLLKYILSTEILKLDGIGTSVYFELLAKLKELKFITYNESIKTPTKVSRTVRLIRRPNIIINR